MTLWVLGAMIGCSNNSPHVNSRPKSELEARQHHIKQQETTVSHEAQARKDRSIARLKAEKVPVIEHLPVIETETESTRRTTEARLAPT